MSVWWGLAALVLIVWTVLGVISLARWVNRGRDDEQRRNRGPGDRQ